MQAKRSIAAMILVITLIALLAGCGRRETEAPPPTVTAIVATNTPTVASTATNTPEPTDTPSPAPSAAPTEAVDVADALTLVFNLPSDVLETFRSRGNLNLVTLFEDGASEEETLALDAAYSTADNESGFNQFFELEAVRADLAEPQTLAIYEVDDVVAALFDGTWRTTTRSDAILSMADNPFTPPLVQLTTGMTEANAQGTVEFSGVEAIHYQSNDPTLFLNVASLDLDEGQEAEAIQLDVWVAVEGNYILGYALSATINDAIDFDAQRNQVRVDQKIDWQFEIYDINSDIDIQVPPEAPEPSSASVPGFAEGEFPLPNGAEMKTDLFGQTEIMTDLSETEVMNFYQQTLTELGWKIEDSFGLYEATKDELRFSMTAMTTDQGKTMVRIRND